VIDEEQDIENKIRQEAFDRQHDKHLNDIRSMLKSPEGRRVMWYMLSSCRTMAASMSANPYDTAYREGQRSIGLMLLDDIMEAKPEAYDQMRREYASNSKTDDFELKRRLKEELGGL